MTITREDILRFFSYKEGDLYWNIRPASDFGTSRGFKIFNSMYAGKIAGSVNSWGYRAIRIGGKDYYAHRLIWIHQNGDIPDGYQVDHVNHVKSDNNISNLRIVSELDNHRNYPIRKNNKSGHTGVRFEERTNKWIAFIKIDGKRIHLGSFASIGNAITARKKKEREAGFHQNHGLI